jgi:hypothetical protein
MAKTDTKTTTTPQQQIEALSVAQLVPTMQKYVVEILRSDDKNAVDPVFIGNGDYQVTLKRGIPVVVPQAVVTVLRDAITGIVDAQTKEVVDVPSYPFTAIPYDGDEPIGTVMSLQTMKRIAPAKPH